MNLLNLVNMDGGFELPVCYDGKEFMFPAELHLYGFTQKIEVLVNGINVMFERDEERKWRALVDPTEIEKHKSIDRGLLRAIADSIEEVLN